MKKIGLTQQILLAMAVGVGIGTLINAAGNEGWVEAVFTEGIFRVIGQVFLSLLNLLVVPLVFVSLVCGTASLEDARKLGRVGLKSVLLYMFTTALAITVALTSAVTFKPGEGMNIESDAAFEAGEAPPLTEVIIDIFPSNPVQAMAEGNMLQIIVFSILFGFAMTLSGEPGRRVLKGFEDVNRIIMKLVTLVMKTAPIGVLGLIAATFAVLGIDAIQQLAQYVALVLVVLFFHALVVYPVLLWTFTRLNPVIFLKKMRTAQLFAFSTASSNATLPITLSTTQHRLGADKSTSSFTVPLGATINMDGTAIMQGVATVFIAQAYVIDLTVADYLMVILTATMASVGTAGVPGVGLIMLAMVLNQVGLPVEGIAIILGVDRIVDMVRTAVNVTGDATITCIVSKSEKQFDEKRFNTPEKHLPDEPVDANGDSRET